jgi:dUTP pyrophosphatase
MTTNCELNFKYIKVHKDAIEPSKNHPLDTGFDLHLIKKIKEYNNVSYFDTGIAVRPPNGYYFDLVGRSSIAKTGWMLANNIGIIDFNYTGTVIVALIKIDPNANELELPCKLVQLIPRNLILMNPIESNYIENTDRADSGGLGSKSI